MLEQAIKITSIIFVLFWSVIIFSEYWHYNPNYGHAFKYFQYADLLAVLVLMGTMASWGIAKFTKTKNKKIFVNGLAVFGILLLLDILAVSFFYGKMSGMDLTPKGLLSHLGHFTGVALCIYLIYLVCRVSGTLLTNIFPPKILQDDLPVIRTALGIMLITFTLFFLGIFHLLYIFIIAPLFTAILLLNWRITIQVIKATLLKPIEISRKFNALGIFSFLFLATFLVFDFVQILRPFPLGTDSINLYVNLPTLISEYAGLVDGHQPYNWSLFMSLGLVVFGRVDVVLALAFFGGILTLLALFRLSRKWLDVNHTMFCLLLFFSVPMINFLSYMDMKIDLGLLYFAICILILFVNWVAQPDLTKAKKVPIKASVTKRKKGVKQQKLPPKSAPINSYIIKTKSFFANRMPLVLTENRIVVLMGLFAGFAFGIKMTTLLIFFALMTALWYAEGGIWTFCSAVFLVAGTMFLLRLDEQALLRQYHQNVSILQWILLVIGLGLGLYIGLNRRQAMLQLIKKSSIISIFFMLPVLPWLGKNWLETKSFSTEALLNGKKAFPEIDIKTLEKNWKEAYE